jgi:protoporphyrinogen oxidase
MMGPMLQNKFGLPSREISAAFLHGRIRGIAKTKSNAGSGECMGYLSGSLQPLTDRLESLVREHAEIHVNCPVLSVEKHGNVFQVKTAQGVFESEKIINTLPLEVFEKLPKNFPFHSEVEYQSAVCGIFRVEEKLTDFYWTNIIDDRIPFKVLVNQSKLDSYPGTVLYCGNYLRSTAELFQLPEEEIKRRHLEGLRLMFGKVTLLDAKIFKARYATPIYDRHFAGHTEKLEQTIPGMTFAGNIKIYPNGRTLSNILKTGYEAAARVCGETAVAG